MKIRKLKSRQIYHFTVSVIQNLGTDFYMIKSSVLGSSIIYWSMIVAGELGESQTTIKLNECKKKEQKTNKTTQKRLLTSLQKCSEGPMCKTKGGINNVMFHLERPTLFLDFSICVIVAKAWEIIIPFYSVIHMTQLKCCCQFWALGISPTTLATGKRFRREVPRQHKGCNGNPMHFLKKAVCVAYRGGNMIDWCGREEERCPNPFHYLKQVSESEKAKDI